MAELENPDIIVHIGRFTPTISDSDVYECKYFVTEDSVYYKDKTLRNSWAFQLSGLEHRAQLKLNIHTSSYTLRSLIAPGLFTHILLMPIIELQLLKMNYLFPHAGAVSKDGRAYLLSGRGAAFKTSLVMNLVRNGYGYMGDERVVVGPKSILSFPTHIKIFSFYLSELRDENIRLFDRLRLVAFLTKHNTTNAEVTDESQLSGLFYISPSSTAFHANKLDVETAVTKMKFNQRLDYLEMAKVLGLSQSPILGCLMAYLASHPKSQLTTMWKDFSAKLRQLLRSVPIHELSIPLEYRTETTDFVRKLMD